MEQPEYETPAERKDRLDFLLKSIDIIQSGYGGILPTGTIVDRRIYPTAVPIQENKLFGIPKPKEI